MSGERTPEAMLEEEMKLLSSGARNLVSHTSLVIYSSFLLVTMSSFSKQQ